MIETTQRLKQLYREGGIKEAYRGIRDYLLLQRKIPVDLFYQTKRLQVNDTSILLSIEGPESYWRSTGFGEMEVLRDFEQRVDYTDTVLDVGANSGVYSLIAAEKGAYSYAFEPGIESINEFRINTEINETAERIELLPVALSDTAGTTRLSREHKTGSRSVGKEGDMIITEPGDNLSLPNPTVIKIDVEGHEKAVIDGLSNTLLTAETIYLELHNVAIIDVLRPLWDMGYEITTEWDNREGETHLRLDKVKVKGDNS